MLILLEGNLKTSYLKKRWLIISSELLYTIVTLDSTTCNMEGHIKLFDRLSDPSGRLIHLRSRYRPSQTSHVSFASGCTASQFAILNSVKRTVTLPRIFPTNLVESRDTGYKPVKFTANCLTMPYSILLSSSSFTAPSTLSLSHPSPSP